MSIKSAFIYICFLSLILSPIPYTYAEPINKRLVDAKFCGDIKRDKKGRIKRNPYVVKFFKDVYPCPSTMNNLGVCPNWQVDHIIPLACGGCDTVDNLQWLPNIIKTAKGKNAKDRWERKLYCNFTKPIELDL